MLIHIFLKKVYGGTLRKITVTVFFSLARARETGTGDRGAVAA
jgi:hypothetical protein